MKDDSLIYGPNYEDYGIIGKSEKITEVIAIAKTVSPTDISVLITGESGTGKEVFASLIHKLSKRKSKKFIAINCGAIPEGLIENELFGHEKGSYTSASEFKKGYFETADGGTIFLDEIGELPLSSQVKLLRVLESGSFMRVGGNSEVKVDVRIVAATNKDLAKMVEQKTFREDLYFRLKAVHLYLPALRERLEDIPLFVYKFAESSAEKHGLPILSFDKSAISLIINQNWKGNIRELKNFIDMLTVMEAGKIVTDVEISKYLKDRSRPSNLPIALHDENEASEKELIFRSLLEIKSDLHLIKKFLFTGGAPQPKRHDELSYSGLSVDKYAKNREHLDYAEEIMAETFIPTSEKEEIEMILKKHNGNRRKAAKELGISERTLYRKLVKYDLQ